MKKSLLDENLDCQVLGLNMILTIPSTKRILIVDDEPYNVMGMQVNLNRIGIKGLSRKVDRAYNGQEALKKVISGLEDGLHVYGLVLTDISMPVMDGFELAEEIRSFYR